MPSLFFKKYFVSVLVSVFYQSTVQSELHNFPNSYTTLIFYNSAQAAVLCLNNNEIVWPVTWVVHDLGA